MWFEVLVPDTSVSEGVIVGERKGREEKRVNGAQRLGETLWGHLYFKSVKRESEALRRISQPELFTWG